uniref:Uncharacterized protein n=1 Tax=Anguilla anguilla TaxID=7936 RepID=A0A0E9QC04_ANGAN
MKSFLSSHYSLIMLTRKRE